MTQNSLIRAINSNSSLTENGMSTFSSSMNHNVDLFFKFGARRGSDIIPAFSKAFSEDKTIATRIALWGRDAREGSGERQLFRDILKYLIDTDVEIASRVLSRIPELGRWDDLYVAFGTKLENQAKIMFKTAIEEKNGLAAKWIDRKGPNANILRKYLKMDPKTYRKTLVELTKVVEQQMCAKEFDKIEFEKVPSLAHSRYTKAFHRNAPDEYQKYLNGLVKGETKINVGAIYPYDIIKSMKQFGKSKATTAIEQWKALPNYSEESQKIITVVDVSGSMAQRIGNNQNLLAIDVALSLGLYFSDKMEGTFKDCFITFSSTPKLQMLKGDIFDKMLQLNQSEWGMSTNLEAVFNLLLDSAVKGNVPENDMPTMILIMSDMEFNACCKYPGAKAFEMIGKKYEDAGYKIPNVIFWNIASRHETNVPVEYKEKGVGLVSGFSPSIIKSILSAKQITPLAILIETIGKERYNF